MPAITLPVGRGTATGIDPSLTDKLTESVGVVYRVGDPAAHKFPGRTKFNSAAIGSLNVNDVWFVDGSLLAFASDSHLYKANAGTTGTFSDNWTFPGTLFGFDVATLLNQSFIVSGFQSQSTSPFGALVLGSTSYRFGLAGVATAPVTGTTVGTIVAGTYTYWTTEYDSVHNVESRHGTPYSEFFLVSAVTISPGPNAIEVFKPTTVNASADKWRIYRTIAGGAAPIGWLVTELDMGTASYVDNTADADLVLNETYRIVTVNGVPESMDGDPQELALNSIASFQGSLVGTTTSNGDFAWTPAGEPHSWPDSYRITFPTKYSGESNCVRVAGDGAYVMFNSETFVVNYLPDQRDSVFDTGICVDHVANYGTPSNRGACAFTAWGGQSVLFVASLEGPILITRGAVDRAVRNIDWASIVPLTVPLPFRWKCVDNPDKSRVEFTYQDDPNTLTSWKCLHFYYDSERSVTETGPLPEMAWTGPHTVPGPSTFGFGSIQPLSWTAGNVATGFVWTENSGLVDNAQLIDTDGTIQFRLRTNRVYPGGLDSESRADRVFIHKQTSTSEQEYDVTFTGYRENGLSTAYPGGVDGTGSGLSSRALNVSHISFDVRVTADGNTGMAPINNITVRLEDKQGKSLKTTTVSASA